MDDRQVGSGYDSGCLAWFYCSIAFEERRVGEQLGWRYASGNYVDWGVGKAGHTFTFGAASDVALVKIGPIKPGKIDAGFLYAAYVWGTGNAHYGGGAYDRIYNFKSSSVTVGSCSTPDVSVNLGSYVASSFSTVGSRTKPVAFDLKINDCAANLASVFYGFNVSSGTGYSAKDGLIDLKSGATAKGIQVKLMGADGTTTVELDKWYPLTAYSKDTGGSYTVSLSAAYERTGDVVAGSADAELVIAMS